MSDFIESLELADAQLNRLIVLGILDPEPMTFIEGMEAAEAILKRLEGTVADMNITLTMRDGTVKKFEHEGRSGGSYTKELRYEKGFVVVKDEWDKETCIPSADILEIKTEPTRR